MHRLAARLHAATGAAPEVDRPRDSYWRLALSNERAALRADIGPDGRGRPTGLKITAVVNGRRWPPVNNLYAVVAAYHPLDDEKTFSRQAPAPLPPVRDPEQAPSAVRGAYTGSARRLPDEVEIALGYAEEVGWVLGMSRGQRHLRLYYAPTPTGGWALDPLYPAQVIIDGRDHSVATAGKLTKAANLFKNGRHRLRDRRSEARREQPGRPQRRSATPPSCGSNRPWEDRPARHRAPTERRGAPRFDPRWWTVRRIAWLMRPGRAALKQLCHQPSPPSP
ncbi:hypothetical protein [Actinomadura sp. SCN-SB]|uniref:hypothetical protein n=1 Tax=Actinomadura sp. SCN-SB TaxID=3373092 RepID=UPI003752C682